MPSWTAVIFGFLGGFTLGWWKFIRRIPKPYRNFRNYSFRYRKRNKKELVSEMKEAMQNSFQRNINDP